MQWCWSVNPKPIITGEIYTWIAIDAKHLLGAVCCIIRDEYYVRTWSYGIRENSDLWISALMLIPRPDAVVTDGQKGILKALNTLWPTVVIQRCLVHVERNMREKLTMHPQSEAGLDLQWLMGHIWKINSYKDMVLFVAIFDELYYQHSEFIKQRTYKQDDKIYKIKRNWWYTHKDVRGAYRQIDKLIRDDHLFAYITYPKLNIPKTTNGLEGGINSRIDELLHRHRGMQFGHQRRIVDWYLDSRSEAPYFTRKTK